MKRFEKFFNDYLSYCIIFCFVVYLFCWLSDDAIMGLVPIKNMINGNGLRWNVQERVCTSTSLLYFLSVGLLSLPTNHVLVTAIIFNMLCSCLLLYIIIKHCHSSKQKFLVLFVLIFSQTFLSFTTSGLENSMLALLESIWLYMILEKETFSSKDLFLLSFICAITLGVRLDSAVLLFIPTAYIFLFKRDCKLCKSIFVGILGLLPLFVLLCFSLVYFGFLFPNTFYAKMHTGISSIDYIVHGIKYFLSLLLCDPLAFITIIVAIVLCIRDKKLRIIGVSFILKLSYLIYVGGDFMVGRFITDLYVLSVILIIYKGFRFNKVLLGLLCTCSVVVFFIYSVSSVNYVFSNGSNDDSLLSIIDERAFWGFKGIKELIELEQNWCTIDCEALKDLDQYITYDNNIIYQPIELGISRWHLKNDCYIIDSIALSNAFISRFPCEDNNLHNFRIGHIRHKYPDGYIDSLINNKNLLTNDKDAKLYDDICLVTKGDLFTKERWKAILRLNFGIGD